MVTAIAFAGKAVAAPAISFLLGKAFSYLDKYRKSEGTEELRNRLVLAIPKIQAVFDVVNPDHVREQSRDLDAWLWQLRDAVEDAENVVDELDYYELEEKAEQRKVSDSGSSLAKMKHNVVRPVRKASIMNKTLKRLRKAVESLDRAAAGVASFLVIADRLKESASTSKQQLVNYDHETSSELSVAKFVGRRKEKEKIIGWITKTPVESAAETVTSTHNVSIVSVVGHGGMGKTTLAQSICKEGAVRNHFEVIWVTVSTNFNATSVTSKILESVTGNKPSSDHLEPLQKHLKEKLRSMKFLLVLDDVWEDEKEGEWDKLFAPLRNVNSGSTILLTTRMRSVADMATSVMGVERAQCLTLQELENDENIELFNHHVSSGMDPKDCERFKSTGEQIAKKLGGCPLVTKVIAGHLRGNRMIEYWDRFLHEGLEHFSGTEEGFMRVLRLSYYSLPTELQICFRYCCLFPQDYEFRKKELIQMWMGSGLISQHSGDLRSYEDIGEQILVQLNKKSFLDLRPGAHFSQGVEYEYYVMHDLMHDLARNVSSGECARISHPAMFEDDNRTVRHMCIANIHSFSVEEVKKISNFKYLRTIIIGSTLKEENKDVVCALERVVESLKCLRLLCSGQRNLYLTYECRKLKHLRYLRLKDISREGMCGVGRLYHLMLFEVVSSCFRKLKEVRYLGNLDCLRYVQQGKLGKFSVGRLTHLQELKNYEIKESIGNKLSAIKNLKSLQTLQVKGLEKVKNAEEAKDAKLNEMISLNYLSLSWSFASSAKPNNTDALVLDNLKPHSNVRELDISGYTGVKLPFWIEDLCIRNLVSLKLYACLNWERLPSFGKLVWLRHIRLFQLFELQQIGHLSSSDTSMEFLLPPRLETIDVSSCPKLSELPVLPPSLVSLTIYEVGLTKLPMIDSERSETKPSQLVKIAVRECCSLTSLKGSLFDQKMHMGALQSLKIENCINLASGSIAFERMNKLTELRIMGCPKFSTMGDIEGELQTVEVTDCPKLSEISVLSPSLFSLRISGFGLAKLPMIDSENSEAKPSQLMNIAVRNCNSVTLLEGSLLEQMSMGALWYLRIAECANLEFGSVAFDGMNILTELGIRSCPKFSMMGTVKGELTCLNRLELCGWSDLVSLPSADVFMSFKLLQKMEIVGCQNLSSLGGLGSLPSLHCLRIKSCSKLVEFASSLTPHASSGGEEDHLVQIYKLVVDLPSLLLLEPLKRLNRTTELEITKGSKMESLPERWLIQNRQFLRRLTISKAKSLKSLPLSIWELSSLEMLYIFDYHSELLNEIRKNSNSESNKVSHIRRAAIAKYLTGGTKGDWYSIMGKECDRRTFFIQ